MHTAHALDLALLDEDLLLDAPAAPALPDTRLPVRATRLLRASNAVVDLLDSTR